MARILEQIVSPPHTCPYLGEQLAVMESRIMVDVAPLELDNLLCHGWRRFGPTYFRPQCAPCNECVSLRVPVATFVPTKSQRRAERKCAGITQRVGVPRVNAARMALYHAWHAMREKDRGWTEDSVDDEQYALQFCFPHPCARELSYYDGEKLIGVGIVDETPTAVSSVYFYFDPAYRHLSLGVASALREIDYARRRGRAYLYLGYRVLACPSLVYKGTFGPHELLDGRPSLEDTPRWVPPAEHVSTRLPAG